MDKQSLSNSDAWAKHFALLLVAKGILPRTMAELAYDALASNLGEEEDAGTIEFHEPPNWPIKDSGD